MVFKHSFLLTAMLLFLIALAVPVNAFMVVAEQTTNNSMQHFGRTAANAFMAQEFKPNQTRYVDSIIINLRKVGAPADDVNFSIQTSVGDEPSGLLVHPDAHGIIPAASLTATLHLYELNFTDGFELTAWDRYWLVADRTGALHDGDYYSWAEVMTNEYVNGTYAVMAAIPNWTNQTRDTWFQVIGTDFGVPRFNWAPQQPVANETTDFYVLNLTEWNYTTIHWNFSEGGANTTGVVNTTHTFATNATVEVCIMAERLLTGANITFCENVTVYTRPIAGFTYSPIPTYVSDLITLNDTSTGNGFAVDTWQLDWWDGSANTTTQNGTHSYTHPGQYLVIQTVWAGNVSRVFSANITVVGAYIIAVDERMPSTNITFNVTLFNASNSYTYYDQTIFLWANTTNIPIGDVTILVWAEGYPQRRYFVTLNNDTYISLVARLLGVYDGIYSNFVVEDNLGTPVGNATMTFRRLYNMTYLTVAQALTDSAGQTQVFLDPFTRYLLHVERGTDTFDGDLEPVAGVIYHVIFGELHIHYSMSSPIKIAIEPQSLNYGDQMNVSIYDIEGSLVEYNITITLNNGTQIYSYNGTDPTGATVLINTSNYVPPSHQFEPWTVDVSYRPVGEQSSGFSTYKYFMNIGSATGIAASIEVGDTWLSSEAKNAVSLLIVIGVGAGASFAGGMVGLVAAVITAIILGYVGWLNYLAVLLALAAAVLMIYIGRKRGD